jgi:hypothetical protein
MPKTSIPGRGWLGGHCVTTQNICDEFILHHLLHHSPHKARARDTALFCSLLEILNFQWDDDILDGHQSVPNAPFAPLICVADQQSWQEFETTAAPIAFYAARSYARKRA